MDIKKDILWRVYLVFLCIIILGFAIIGKTVYIQRAEGNYWKKMSDSLHLEYRELDAERGTIYSEDGSMLSTSIPYFDVRIDFAAQGLRAKNGMLFTKNIDTLSMELAALFKDFGADYYKELLNAAYKRKDRYFLLRRNINFEQYKTMGDFHLIKEGRNKSGFIFEDKEKRLTPFGLLANRTIGLAREYRDKDGNMVRKNVGLELTYDTLLKGENGRRLVRRLAGGAFVPIEGSEIEPQNGHDIVTTIDVNLQDITESALMKMLKDNGSEHGTAIVMEVKTGKIKAIANLGLQPDGSFAENLNYAIRKTEPGSTFKLLTMLAVFEDKFTTVNGTVNLENGVWPLKGGTVRDSEPHGRTNVSVKQAFELSSNVGMAKLAVTYYSQDPNKFLGHIRRLGFEQPTGVGLIGETKSEIHVPGSKYWNGISLPWMSFGYSISFTPLHTLMLYNAIANGGKMMRPYLVNSIMKDGKVVRAYSPEVKLDAICSPQTLSMLKECLEGVVLNGTAKNLANTNYKIAGKTGTALVSDVPGGYNAHIYQSSFAGYFPADNPQYSCIVVIRNKIGSKKFYGSLVAAPVFKEIADKLYAINLKAQPVYRPVVKVDSSIAFWSGYRQDFEKIFSGLGMNFRDSSGKKSWAYVQRENNQNTAKILKTETGVMPNLKGMGLKDALYLIESLQLNASVRGVGKVFQQSLAAGEIISKGQTVYIDLN